MITDKRAIHGSRDCRVSWPLLEALKADEIMIECRRHAQVLVE